MGSSLVTDRIAICDGFLTSIRCCEATSIEVPSSALGRAAQCRPQCERAHIGVRGWGVYFLPMELQEPRHARGRNFAEFPKLFLSSSCAWQSRNAAHVAKRPRVALAAANGPPISSLAADAAQALRGERAQAFARADQAAAQGDPRIRLDDPDSSVPRRHHHRRPRAARSRAPRRLQRGPGDRRPRLERCAVPRLYARRQ
jgi:hypothetical protein